MQSLALLALLPACLAAPQYLLAHPYAYAALHPTVVTGNAVPVSVGGYKVQSVLEEMLYDPKLPEQQKQCTAMQAVAGSNGDLAGPVHEVPGLVPALATATQESAGDVSLTTGTGALAYAPVIYGKRSAEAEPQVSAGPASLFLTKRLD